MGTTIPRDALRTIVSAATELPEAFIIWDGEPKAPVDFASDAKRIILNIVARRPVGVDEETRAYVADPDNTPDGMLVVTTYSGQRELTVSVRAENFGAEEGYDLLERLGLMLGADSNRAKFTPLGTAFIGYGNIQTFPGTAGNRKISIAQVDLFLNQRIDRVVTTVGDTFIESVDADGEFTA